MYVLVRPCILGFCLLATTAPAIAEGEAREKEAGCAHSVESVPQMIKGILSPIYAVASDSERLVAASKALETLMSEANFCRVFVLSGETTSEEKQRDAMEWKSLNQWLYRLSNFTSLNAKGDTAQDWRKEYEIFAELYELKI